MSNSIIPLVLLETQQGQAIPGFSLARPKDTRGYGAEAWGDPYGAGGPLSVVRAQAVGGQTVRVAFNEEPAHFSAASPVDALNPKNWQMSVVTGQVVAVPMPVGIQAVGPGPLIGVREGEWGVDVKLDRPLARLVRYRIDARTMVARAGLGLGFPYGAEFLGATLPTDFRPPRRRTDMADFSTDPRTGGWVFDGSGDIGVDDGPASYKKRVIRRATTPKGSYSFFGRDYGTILALKRPLSLAQVGPIKADLASQIRREPETLDVSVQASFQPLPGILSLAIIAQARQGSLSTGLQASESGLIVVE
jgi:hypothetical protein